MEISALSKLRKCKEKLHNDKITEEENMRIKRELSILFKKEYLDPSIFRTREKDPNSNEYFK